MNEVDKRTKIVQQIKNTIVDVLNSQQQKIDPVVLNENTSLIGREAVLESMGLVNILVELEQFLQDTYSITQPIVSEKALSRKSSPFRTIGSLADYMLTMVAEA